MFSTRFIVAVRKIDGPSCAGGVKSEMTVILREIVCQLCRFATPLMSIDGPVFACGCPACSFTFPGGRTNLQGTICRRVAFSAHSRGSRKSNRADVTAAIIELESRALGPLASACARAVSRDESRHSAAESGDGSQRFLGRTLSVPRACLRMLDGGQVLDSVLLHDAPPETRVGAREWRDSAGLCARSRRSRTGRRRRTRPTTGGERSAALLCEAFGAAVGLGRAGRPEQPVTSPSGRSRSEFGPGRARLLPSQDSDRPQLLRPWRANVRAAQRVHVGVDDSSSAVPRRVRRAVCRLCRRSAAGAGRVAGRVCSPGHDVARCGSSSPGPGSLAGLTSSSGWLATLFASPNRSRVGVFAVPFRAHRVRRDVTDRLVAPRRSFAPHRARTLSHYLEECFMTVRNWQRRVGLTLIELVVVLVILSVLAALVIPRIGNISGQANAATSGPVIAEVNRAVLLYENRYGKSPSGQDGLLTGPTTGTLFSPMHSGIQIGTSATQGGADPAKPSLYPLTLSPNQLASLNAAGITSVHYNVPGSGNGRPSDSATDHETLTTSTQLAGLMIPTTSTTPAWTGHGTTFPDRAFNINPFNGGRHVSSATVAGSAFVVFGVGNQGSLRGTTLIESPIVNAANPATNYARVMIVYRIPAASSLTTAEFPAQYIGAFSPDGTSINDNIYNFNTSDKPLSQ